jgi:hypothetical protein
MNNFTQNPVQNNNTTPNQLPTTTYSNSDSSTKLRVPKIPKFWQNMLFILIFNIIFLTISAFLVQKIIRQRIDEDQDVLLETRYKKTSWKNYGEVIEPIIDIPIYYSEQGYKPESFLLDSGALVSSLPREKAEPMGYSLAMLPRSTFKGFGNTTTFAYRANIKAQVGTKEVDIPVVFTEAVGTKSILGRTGFFENYSIYFDSKAQKIQIRN